ncbi:MAG TPA: potassium channel family protein [Pirellulales bacterium]|nr:potassium channel family protein [Pirellulales bacterium]
MGAVLAVAMIVVVLVDSFESLILPRRIAHRFRIARAYYRSAWYLWAGVARRLQLGKFRNGMLAAFGPSSLFGLFALWGSLLILGFALLHWSLGTDLHFPEFGDKGFASYLYFSGTTFLTLGYGDIVPLHAWGRTIAVVEAGIGFGFLAVVISYLPVLYQAFSGREVTISLLDARAGSPPTAGELLRRLAEGRSLAHATPMLVDWERWSAELLESHLSYPVLRFYRSQHDNQSWVAALTTILDTSALLIAGVEADESRHHARLTFAMARHAAVDLCLVAQVPVVASDCNRLSPTDFARLRESLRSAGLTLRDGAAVETALNELRALYEPFVVALATQLEFAVPPFLPDTPPVDNWQRSAWMQRSPSLGGLPTATFNDEHFD